MQKDVTVSTNVWVWDSSWEDTCFSLYIFLDSLNFLYHVCDGSLKIFKKHSITASN